MTAKPKTKRGGETRQAPKQNLPKQNPVEQNPPSIEERRTALAQKIEAFVMETQLQDCARMACRRRHACTRESACESRQRRHEETPEQWERAKALLVRELARRRAESQRP